MHYCLNKIELSQLINLKFKNQRLSDENIKIVIGNSENWQDELGCITYLFSMILERNKDAYKECIDLINLYFELPDQMFIRIESFNFEFIDFMIRNKRSDILTLEEELIELDNRKCEYEFKKTIRY